MALQYILLAFGVFCCSTAVIMVKACGVEAIPLAAYRQLIAAAVLAPLFVREWRRHASAFGRRQTLRAILPGVLLGTHFMTWIYGARLTDAANASLIVNMVPIVMPFLLHVLIRERLTRGEWLATAIALAGLLVLTAADYEFRPDHFLGDVVCLGSMLLFAGYLALGRRNRDFPSIWLYIPPVYLAGGMACLLTALAAGSDLAVPSPRDWLLVLGLGIVPTVLGHSLLNVAMRHLRGQTVSIANLSQFLFAGVLAFFLLDEIPAWNFYLAAVLVVAGAVLAVRSTPREARKPQK